MAKKSKIFVRKAGFVVKHHNAEAAALAVEMARFLQAKGIRVVFEKEAKSIARSLAKAPAAKAGRTAKSKSPDSVTIMTKEKLAESVDLIIVLGGDGTFISIARHMKKKSVPVLGVNMGQLGFLTEIKRKEAFVELDQIIKRRSCIISERDMLDVTLLRKNRKIFQGPVVNDVVISKGAIARVIGVQIFVDGQWVNTVRADGVIVSTPTGSTAYNLAAGGPIMQPQLPAVVITPICAHSLTHRPLVIKNDSKIEIRLAFRPGHVLLTLDGQDAVNMDEDDIVAVSKFSKHPLRLISSPTRDYFSLIREKFKFGMRA